MKVILLQDIKALGKRGDVKNVADGYARNFLLPRSLAKPATEGAVKEVEAQKAKVNAELEELRGELANIEKATAAEPLVFQVKVGEKGEVFGSVGASEIRKRLSERLPKIPADNLKIEADHIREVGRQEITVNLGQGIEGKVTIEVVPQQP